MTGARTPEELETLFEDAVVLRDLDAVRRLFEDRAVLATRDGGREARGAGAIAQLATTLWERGGYLADPWRVLQMRDTALVVAAEGISVARRRRDGTWRYAISLLSLTTTPEEER